MSFLRTCRAEDIVNLIIMTAIVIILDVLLLGGYQHAQSLDCKDTSVNCKPSENNTSSICSLFNCSQCLDGAVTQPVCYEYVPNLLGYIVILSIFNGLLLFAYVIVIRKAIETYEFVRLFEKHKPELPRDPVTKDTKTKQEEKKDGDQIKPSSIPSPPL